MAIERGDVFWHDFGASHHNRQGGRRPVLVVQSDALNRIAGYSLTVIVPLTTRQRPAATFVKIDPTKQNGLNGTSWAICNQLYTIPKSELVERAGSLARGVYDEVIRSILITLGIELAL